MSMMAQDYVAVCIRETLIKSKGNIKTAQTMLVELAKADERLLLELTKPYLDGIVAHAVNRAVKKADAQSRRTSKPAVRRPVREPVSALEGLVPNVLSGQSVSPERESPAPVKSGGKEAAIVKAMQVRGATKKKLEQSLGSGTLDGLFAQLAKNFEEGQGDTALAPNTINRSSVRKKASQNHVDALHAIAKHTYRTGKKK